jgi:hypothetical protein
MVVYFIGGSVGVAAGGSLIALLGWSGIGLTAVAALTVAASIVLRRQQVEAERARIDR